MIPVPCVSPGIAREISAVLEDAGLRAVNEVAAARRCPARALVHTIPGLAHTHEPTTAQKVPGCAYCARAGNAFAVARESPPPPAKRPRQDPDAAPAAQDPDAAAAGEAPPARPPPEEDVVGLLAVPFHRALIAAYDAILDRLAAAQGDVEAVRLSIVAPLRRYVDSLEAAAPPPV